MTTTPNPTAEQIVDSVMRRPDWDAYDLTAALREAGQLATAPTEGQIEAVARELAHLDADDPWPTNEQLGGSLTGDRDVEYREGMREQARDLLLVAARATRVAPQEPSGCAVCHRADGHKMDCSLRATLSPDREKLISDALEEAALRITADDDVSDRSNAEAEARADGFNDAMAIMEPYVQRLTALAAPSEVDEAKCAEVVAQASYDWSKQRLEFWRRPNAVEPPGDLDSFIARAIAEALRGDTR